MFARALGSEGSFGKGFGPGNKSDAMFEVMKSKEIEELREEIFAIARRLNVVMMLL